MLFHAPTEVCTGSPLCFTTVITTTRPWEKYWTPSWLLFPSHPTWPHVLSLSTLCCTPVLDSFLLLCFILKDCEASEAIPRFFLFLDFFTAFAAAFSTFSSDL